MTPAEIVEMDRGYLEWLRDKAENLSSELREDIVKILS